VQSETLAARADAFRQRHRAGRILILPNAWDVASARIIAGCGAEAIGTTSMGISASEGYCEGEVTPWPIMLDRIARVARAVEVPVSADIESGYACAPGGICRTVADVLDSGCVGINLEDSSSGPNSALVDPQVLAEKIAAAREVGRARGVHLYINARPDVYLCPTIPPERRLAETLTRARVYQQAGADGIFVPGKLDHETIAVLVREIPLPLNIVANPALGTDVATVRELEALGVARVSVGSALARAALAFTRRAVERLLTDGAYDVFAEELRRPGAQDSYDMAIDARKSVPQS
jgi:2-methylisocitrate lyase-like PEP mutase family enzyme